MKAFFASLIASYELPCSVRTVQCRGGDPFSCLNPRFSLMITTVRSDETKIARTAALLKNRDAAKLIHRGFSK
jgi:hypothetical protein